MYFRACHSTHLRLQSTLSTTHFLNEWKGSRCLLGSINPRTPRNICAEVEETLRNAVPLVVANSSSSLILLPLLRGVASMLLLQVVEKICCTPVGST